MHPPLEAADLQLSTYHICYLCEGKTKLNCDSVGSVINWSSRRVIVVENFPQQTLLVWQFYLFVSTDCIYTDLLAWQRPTQ